MKKSSLFFAVFFAVTCYAGDIVGFRDMLWGDPSSKLGGSVTVEKNEIYKITYRKKIKDNLNIGQSKLDELVYGFFDDKLYVVSAKFEGMANFYSIVNAFESKYGKMSKINKFNDYRLILSRPDSFIVVELNQFTKKGNFGIVNQTISSQKQKYEKDIDEKGAKDL